MRITFLSALLSAFALPQDPAALIDRLRAEDILVRERAFAELEKAGAEMEPALRSVANDPDARFAAHVRKLLRRIELNRLFGENLKKAIPDLVSRISADEENQWLRIYMGIATAEAGRNGEDPFPGLKREDIEPLAGPALRQANTPEIKREVLRIVADGWHRSAEPEVIRLLKDPDSGVANTAIETLLSLRGRGAMAVVLRECEGNSRFLAALHYFRGASLSEAAPRLAGLTQDADKSIANQALFYLSLFAPREALAQLPTLLKSEAAERRAAALERLGPLADRTSASDILPLLSDSTAREEAVRWFRTLAIDVPDAALKSLAAARDSDVREERLRLIAACRSGAEVDEALRLGLEDPDSSVRRWALELLNERAEAKHAARVIPLVRDPDPEVRRKALTSLSFVGGPEAETALRVALRTHEVDPAERVIALESLIALRKAPSTAEVAALLDKAPFPLALACADHLSNVAPGTMDEARIGRLVASVKDGRIESIVDVLVKVGSEPAIKVLLGILDGEHATRLAAGRALYHLGVGRMTPRVRALLKHEDDTVRRMAAQILANWRVGEARPDFIELLGDPEDNVRRAAIYGLTRVGPGEELETIRGFLEEGDATERKEAAALLGQVQDRESVTALRLLLADPECAEAAAIALFELGDREMIPTLAGWLDSAALRKVKRAGEILTLLKAGQVRGKIAGLLNHRVPEFRKLGAELIGLAGDPADAPKVLPLLREPKTCDEAADTLILLNSPAVVPDLIGLLGDTDVVPRLAALKALVGMRVAEAVPKIRALLADPDGGVRAEAAGALGSLGDPSSSAALLEELEDEAFQVRERAAYALGQLGHKAAIPRLLGLLDDPSSEVRHAARRGLVLLGGPEFSKEVVRRFRDPSDRDRIVYLRLLSVVGARESIPDLVALLRAGGLKNAAAAELSKLGAVEAIPDLKRSRGFFAEELARLGDVSAAEAGLKSKDPSRRLEAGRALCELGDRRGVAAIIESVEVAEAQEFPYEPSPDCDRGIHLFFTQRNRINWLNAARNPAAWKRLQETRTPVRIDGTREAVAARLMAAIPCTVQWDATVSFHALDWRRKTTWAGGCDTESTALDALNILFEGYGPWAYILESDHVRILPRDQALLFWKEWVARTK